MWLGHDVRRQHAPARPKGTLTGTSGAFRGIPRHRSHPTPCACGAFALQVRIAHNRRRCRHSHLEALQPSRRQGQLRWQTAVDIACDASRCAARRRGELGPFVRFSFWRSLHVAASPQVRDGHNMRIACTISTAVFACDTAAVAAVASAALASLPSSPPSLPCDCSLHQSNARRGRRVRLHPPSPFLSPTGPRGDRKSDHQATGQQRVCGAVACDDPSRPHDARAV